MTNDKKNGAVWRNWGDRFRLACQIKGVTLAQVADKLGRHESSLRSWTNGNRQINLSEFFLLCDAAEVDPQAVLFADTLDEKLLAVILAWRQADETDKKLLTIAAKAVLEQDAAARSEGTNPQ